MLKKEAKQTEERLQFELTHMKTELEKQYRK